MNKQIKPTVYKILKEDKLAREEWKDVVGYEGLYKVSSFGRIISIRNNKIKSQRLNTSRYWVVDLYKNNQQKTKSVHRLVAEAFIPNPDNKPCVNHIKPVTYNCCDNTVENLEWCTFKENTKHAWKIGRINKNIKSKKIIQYDLHGNFIREWESEQEASRRTKTNQGNISNCCKKLINKANGYIWRYKEETVNE